jgi:DNA end-binding protein Ku
MLDLALHIVESKRSTFEPGKFQDEYEDALKELLRKKQKGEKIERPKEPSQAKFVNLMDALRQSVQQEKGAPVRAKKIGQRIAGQTEMLLPIAGKKGKEAAKPAAKAKRTAEEGGLRFSALFGLPL